MFVTATEFKLNLSKYLRLSQSEDVYITKNGKIVAKLSNPFQDRIKLAESLADIIPADITLEGSREERLHKI